MKWADTATHSIERIVIGFACHRPRVNGSVFLWTTIDPTTIASHPVVASGLLYYRFPRMHNVDDEFIEAAVQCHLENFAYQYCQIFLACSGKLHKANASTTLISMRMTSDDPVSPSHSCSSPEMEFCPKRNWDINFHRIDNKMTMSFAALP